MDGLEQDRSTQDGTSEDNLDASDGSAFGDEAIITQRKQLRRRLTLCLKGLSSEFGKSSPSRRYLGKDLRKAEELVHAIEELLHGHRELLEQQQDSARLDVLDKWEEKFRNDISLLADVSALLEETPDGGDESQQHDENARTEEEHALESSSGAGRLDSRLDLTSSVGTGLVQSQLVPADHSQLDQQRPAELAEAALELTLHWPGLHLVYKDASQRLCLVSFHQPLTARSRGEVLCSLVSHSLFKQ